MKIKKKVKKKKPLEIERRFLLKEFPSIQVLKHLKITQGYNSEGRFRSALDGIKETCYKTVKKTISHGVAEEVENKISTEVFIESKKTWTKVISKTRYIKVIEGNKWEIDIFPHLIIAEVEFKNKKDFKKLVLPQVLKDVLIMEITGIKEFSNFNLANKV